jgi:hypothetical protein
MNSAARLGPSSALRDRVERLLVRLAQVEVVAHLLDEGAGRSRCSRGRSFHSVRYAVRLASVRRRIRSAP